jgi:Uncharacterized conserved protein
MKIIEDISNFIFLENEPEKADMIFIPGGSYAEIAEKAASLWKEGYSDLILPSGRYGVKRGYFPGPLSNKEKYTGRYETEWEFLMDVLIKNGVKEAAVLKEDKAENTYENAIYSKKVTDSYNLNIKKAIICCKAFHARRCLMYYQLLFPEVQFVICPAETHGINKETWFKSEEGIEKVLGELMRCGGQFVDIMKELKL